MNNSYLFQPPGLECRIIMVANYFRKIKNSEPTMEVDSNLKSYVENLLAEAGEVVEEEENQISIAKHEYLLNDKVGSIRWN